MEAPAEKEPTDPTPAIIGGVACGMFKDFNVVDDLLKTAETVQPDPKDALFYKGRTQVLVKAYRALVEVYGDLASGK